MVIFRKLPEFRQIIPVYAVIVFLVYSWTILRFFWKVPSWLLFLTGGEIIDVFAYSIVTNFFESIMIAVLLVLISVLLPMKHFLNMFVIRGTALALMSLGWMIFFAYSIGDVYKFPETSPYWTALALGTTILFTVISGRIALLGKLLKSFAERAIVFLYLWMPINLFCLVVVVLRNLF